MNLLTIRYFFFALWRCGPTVTTVSSFKRFPDPTQRRNSVGRTPLDEWSARRRDLHLTTHNAHKEQTSMPPAGFKPPFQASERQQTHTLDGAVTGIGLEHTHTHTHTPFNMQNCNSLYVHFKVLTFRENKVLSPGMIRWNNDEILGNKTCSTCIHFVMNKRCMVQCFVLVLTNLQKGRQGKQYIYIYIYIYMLRNSLHVDKKCL